MGILALLELLFIALFVSGCRKCVEWDTVKTVGGCAYSSFKIDGTGIGSSECAALTATGHKVFSSRPFVEGESACIRREWK